MFNNTVNLVPTTDSPYDSYIIDGPTNRKTERSFVFTGGMTGILTIAHSQSNENAGLETQRSNVRIELSKEIEDTGKFAKAYVSFIMSTPKGVFTVDEMASLTAMLMNFLRYGENAGADDIVIAADLSTVIQRIYAGEP